MYTNTNSKFKIPQHQQGKPNPKAQSSRGVPSRYQTGSFVAAPPVCSINNNNNDRRSKRKELINRTLETYKTYNEPTRDAYLTEDVSSALKKEKEPTIPDKCFVCMRVEYTQYGELKSLATLFTSTTQEKAVEVARDYVFADYKWLAELIDIEDHIYDHNDLLEVIQKNPQLKDDKKFKEQFMRELADNPPVKQTLLSEKDEDGQAGGTSSSSSKDEDRAEELTKEWVYENCVFQTKDVAKYGRENLMDLVIVDDVELGDRNDLKVPKFEDFDKEDKKDKKVFMRRLEKAHPVAGFHIMLRNRLWDELEGSEEEDTTSSYGRILSYFVEYTELNINESIKRSSDYDSVFSKETTMQSIGNFGRSGMM